MSTRTLAVVTAGLSVPSSTRLLADRLTAATVAALRERGEDATVEVVELREHARDLADDLVTGFANTSLRAAIDTVVGADGLIAVTPRSRSACTVPAVSRSASSRVADGTERPALTTASVRVLIGPPPPRRARRAATWRRRPARRGSARPARAPA